MKKTLNLLALLLTITASFAQVGIGTKNPAISAALEVSSTTKGFLPPRLTIQERNAIPSPEAGLIIFNTDTRSLESSTGTQWVNLQTRALTTITNNAASTGLGLVGIGTKQPNPDAALEVFSNTKGFLPPRMSLSDRNLISNPVAGLTIYNTTDNCLEFFDGSNWNSLCDSPVTQTNMCNAGLPTVVVEVLNPTTNEIWMDRNLGALRRATGATDAAAYGSLFQWGRAADGHECTARVTGSGISNAAITSTVATTPAANMNNLWDGKFINVDVVDGYGENWLNTQNNTLWNGVSATNNPCPAGFRLPTQAEMNAERTSWSSQNATGAFNSPLKWVLNGRKERGSGSLANVGTRGQYWTSSTSSNNPFALGFDSGSASVASGSSSLKADGFGVRCIKD